ncbi:hypothetical protein HMPREF9136_2041 [Prevotella dentalis DSM 3688]|uniref:Uncharacterized protein n=1 Tax=Prevotella dentalis (strain ATCC 49559 / DSM 3688 / JCM 13448 / NCTC 12043 / ES 2772) TaxID=908937 RepID=F9D5B3_PREDD|nr:hypothetical protein HMPREF9136_2041 [Prevotella dentalis DSM 3688]
MHLPRAAARQRCGGRRGHADSFRQNDKTLNDGNFFARFCLGTAVAGHPFVRSLDGGCAPHAPLAGVAGAHGLDGGCAGRAHPPADALEQRAAHPPHRRGRAAGLGGDYRPARPSRHGPPAAARRGRHAAGRAVCQPLHGLSGAGTAASLRYAPFHSCAGLGYRRHHRPECQGSAHLLHGFAAPCAALPLPAGQRRNPPRGPAPLCAAQLSGRPLPAAEADERHGHPLGPVTSAGTGAGRSGRRHGRGIPVVALCGRAGRLDGLALDHARNRTPLRFRRLRPSAPGEPRHAGGSCRAYGRPADRARRAADVCCGASRSVFIQSFSTPPY